MQHPTLPWSWGKGEAANYNLAFFGRIDSKAGLPGVGESYMGWRAKLGERKALEPAAMFILGDGRGWLTLFKLCMCVYVLRICMCVSCKSIPLHIRGDVRAC